MPFPKYLKLLSVFNVFYRVCRGDSKRFKTAQPITSWISLLTRPTHSTSEVEWWRQSNSFCSPACSVRLSASPPPRTPHRTWNTPCPPSFRPTIPPTINRPSCLLHHPPRATLIAAQSNVHILSTARPLTFWSTCPLRRIYSPGLTLSASTPPPLLECMKLVSGQKAQQLSVTERNGWE